MPVKLLPLVGTFFAAPAFAITVNMTDFRFGPPSDVQMTGTSGSPSYSGAAGEFTGLSSVPIATAAPVARLSSLSGVSFEAYCGELTQTFNFGVTYTYTPVSATSAFGAVRGDALSRYFTAAQGFVVDADTSAAFQAGIWEIIYEQDPGFDLTTGTIRGAPADGADQPLFDTVNGFLTHLGDYAPAFRVDVLTNPDNQDFVVGTVPEPGTWALLGSGLGVLAFVARRRRAEPAALHAAA